MKRTILSSRDFYKPFDYPEFFISHKLQSQVHWIPDEIPLHEDINDWNSKTLKESEKFLITNLLRFFTQSDTDVANAYTRLYIPVFKLPEIRMMLLTFSSIECIHQEAYALLNDTLGLDDNLYQSFYDYKAMVDKHEFLNEFDSSNPYNLAKSIAVLSGFTEGLQLFSSFAILLSFPRRNMFKQMGQIISWSVRDESLHVSSMLRVFKILLSEYSKEIDKKKLSYEISSIAEKMVLLEDEFIDICFEKEDILINLTKYEVKEYIRYIANIRLQQMGIKSIYNIKSNPIPWIDEMTSALEYSNFFEQKVTEYSKASITGKWSDIWVN